MKQFHLTESGLAKFQAELETLKSKRVGIAQAIASAREQGDLSENAEYQTAKEEQELLENRIEEISLILKNASLIGKSTEKVAGIVSLGSTVKLQSLEDSLAMTYVIVGTMEADPSENRISDESPVGQKLLGKGLGEEIVLPRPDGLVACKIVAIN